MTRRTDLTYPRLAAVLLACTLGCGESAPTPEDRGSSRAEERTPNKGKPSSRKPSGDTAVDEQPEEPTEEPAQANQELARSPKPSLQWKRHVAFEADLAAALGLPRDALCKEFGKEGCIREVHVSPLGGHDPFRSGLLESSAEPLATTPTVVERIVLSACVKRVELEHKGELPRELFRELDLAGNAPAPTSAATKKTIDGLFRRFLARDPLPQEREVVASLTRDEAGAAVAARDFAKTACLTVGSSSEFLFF